MVRRSVFTTFALVASARSASADVDGVASSTAVWIGFGALVVLVAVAGTLLALDRRRISREELRDGAVSPRIAEELARGKRNRWLVVAAVGFGVAGAGPFVTNDPDAVTLAYFIGVGAAVAVAVATRFHRIVALARWRVAHVRLPRMTARARPKAGPSPSE